MLYACRKLREKTRTVQGSAGKQWQESWYPSCCGLKIVHSGLFGRMASVAWVIEIGCKIMQADELWQILPWMMQDQVDQLWLISFNFYISWSVASSGMATFAPVRHGGGEHPGSRGSTAWLHHTVEINAVPNQPPVRLGDFNIFLNDIFNHFWIWFNMILNIFEWFWMAERFLHFWH